MSAFTSLEVTTNLGVRRSSNRVSGQIGMPQLLVQAPVSLGISEQDVSWAADAAQVLMHLGYTQIHDARVRDLADGSTRLDLRSFHRN